MNGHDEMLPLSPLTMAILLALADGDRHGYALMQEIEAQTQGALKPGTGSLYAGLQRLVSDALIRESVGEPGADRRRRYYSLTEDGRAIAQAEAQRMLRVLGLGVAASLLLADRGRQGDRAGRGPAHAPGARRRGVQEDRSAAPTRRVEVSRALHRLLQRLLPVGFRRAHGEAMTETFLDALEDAKRRGARALGALWTREILDLATTGIRMRVGAGERPPAEGSAVGRQWQRRRGGGTMGLVDDFRYAWRSLVRRPSLTAFAVLTIALGVGSTTAVFSTLESVILNPLPYENGDRMVGLFRQVGNSGGYVPPSPGQLDAWRDMTDVFEVVEPWSGRSMTLTGAGEPREIQAGLVRPAFHDLLGRPPRLGRVFDDAELAGDGARVLLLSHALWSEGFGESDDVLGRSLTLDGEPWTVIGVMPPATPLPGWGLVHVDVWRPLPSAETESGLNASGLIREGVPLELVQERMASVGDPDAEGGQEWTGVATLVRDQVGRGFEGSLRLLMGAVVLLLLIACVNVSNLLLFRAEARRHETAVRSALGGGGARLARQVLIESVVLALLGGAGGVALSFLCQDAILALRPSALDMVDLIAINPRVLGFALLVTVATGLAFGVLPAAQASRPTALDPLRSGARVGGSLFGRRAGWLLVSAELALSFALLLGSLSVLSTLMSKQSTDVGYRADEVIAMDIVTPAWRYETPEERAQVYDALVTRLRRLPGVVHVSRASGVPPRAGIYFGRLEVEGGDPSPDTEMLHGLSVDSAYFATLGQQIVRGRGFTTDDLAGEARLMVIGEETARRYFDGRDPLGTRFRLGAEEEWITVVGVTPDIAMTGLSSGTVRPQVYELLRGSWRGATFLMRTATAVDPYELLPLVRDVTRDVEAELRIDRLTVAASLMRDSLDRERFVTTVMGTFAALAMLLAAIGLYGVVSQAVGRRTREIGIRLALGARRGSIARIVLRRVGSATLVGILLGVGLALGATRLLENQIFGLEASSPGTYVMAAGVLTATALLAAYAPARRATDVDPVEAIRIE